MKWFCLLLGVLSYLMASFPTYGATETWARRDAFNNPQDFNDNMVQEVWSGGAWSHEGVNGYYRFMLTQATEGGPEKLFVQWIVNKNDKGVEEISYFVGVREFNEFPVYDLALPKCLKLNTCAKISIEAKNIYEDRIQTFILSLDGLGHYKFEM